MTADTLTGASDGFLAAPDDGSASIWDTIGPHGFAAMFLTDLAGDVMAGETDDMLFGSGDDFEDEMPADPGDALAAIIRRVEQIERRIDATVERIRAIEARLLKVEQRIGPRC